MVKEIRSTELVKSDVEEMFTELDLVASSFVVAYGSVGVAISGVEFGFGETKPLVSDVFKSFSESIGTVDSSVGASFFDITRVEGEHSYLFEEIGSTCGDIVMGFEESLPLLVKGQVTYVFQDSSERKFGSSLVVVGCNEALFDETVAIGGVVNYEVCKEFSETMRVLGEMKHLNIRRKLKFIEEIENVFREMGDV